MALIWRQNGDYRQFGAIWRHLAPLGDEKLSYGEYEYSEIYVISPNWRQIGATWRCTTFFQTYAHRHVAVPPNTANIWRQRIAKWRHVAPRGGLWRQNTAKLGKPAMAVLNRHISKLWRHKRLMAVGSGGFSRKWRHPCRGGTLWRCCLAP